MLLKGTILVTILSGCVLAAMLVFHFSPKNPVVLSDVVVPIEKVVVPPKEEPARYDAPVRLKIPKINVDAAVVYVGLASGGAMDIPKSPDDVAWYELGPRPGEKGSAVIAGHYGWKDGKPSAFDRLYKLRPGDKIYIEDQEGVSTTFVVRESRRYDPRADASEVFSSNDGKAHLNLITCEGAWNKVSQSYPKRLVVFTNKEVP